MYLVLAYHRIGCPSSGEPGSDPVFTISEQQFRDQIETISRLGIPVISQSELVLRLFHGIAAKGPTLVLGFDDGNDSDLEIVAPLLEGRFPAIFYLTIDHLGDRLPFSAPRELLQAGFEVGCHGWTHRYLTHLSDSDLRREISEAKEELTQIAGESVDHFAYPGGRWNARSEWEVRQADFISSVNTAPYSNSCHQNPYRINRLGVKNTFDLDTFEGILLQEPKVLTRIQRRAKRVRNLERVVGESGLDWIRKQIYS